MDVLDVHVLEIFVKAINVPDALDIHDLDVHVHLCPGTACP